jgi:hypothetical protein
MLDPLGDSVSLEDLLELGGDAEISATRDHLRNPVQLRRSQVAPPAPPGVN